MDGLKEKIYKLLGNFSELPFLFIGSGFTQRYKKSYNWEQLLKYLSKIANNNSAYAYSMYKDKAIRSKGKVSVESKVAEYIEEDFNRAWYTEDIFREKREKYNDVAFEGCSPMKIEIGELFCSISSQSNNTGMENEINLFSSIGKRSIAGIITTNYDTVIEEFFKEYKYKTYIGQEELVFSAIQGSGEIYKIHGSCKNSKSIVINDEDYKEFNKKNAYLAAKLLTIFLEHPIIFLGYRIGDSNIKEIMKAIVNCLSDEKLKKLNSRFFFIEWNNTESEDYISDYEFSVDGEKSIKMTKIYVKNYDTLYEALLKNKASYNPRVLRKIWGDIYAVAIQSKPSEKIKVLLDIDDDRLDEVEAVVGIGLIEKLGYKGYEGIGASDLFYDVIYDAGYEGSQLNNIKIVEKCLPNILTYNQSVPMHKYICDYTGTLDSKILKHVKNNFTEYLTNAMQKEFDRGRFSGESISELRSKYTMEDCLRLIPILGEDKINTCDLKTCIVDYLDQNTDIIESNDKSRQFHRTNIKRIIKIYDYLKYHKCNRKESS